MKDSKKVIKYFLPFFKKHIWLGLSVPLLFVLGNVAQMTIAPLYYKKIVNSASLQTASQIFDFKSLLFILLIIAVINIFGTFFRRLGSHVLNIVMNSFTTDIHQDSFNKVIAQGYDFFANNFVGTLSGKASRLAWNFKSIYETIVFGFFLLIIDIILTVAILMTENIKLGLLFLFLMLIFIAFSFSFIKKQARLDKKRASKNSIRNGILSDVFSNSANVQSFASYFFEHKYYSGYLEELSVARLKSWFFANKVRIYKGIFFIIFEILTMSFVLYLFTQQEVSLGSLVLVQTYIFSIIMSSWNLDKSLVSFIEVFSDSVDAIDVVTSPLSILNINNPFKLKMNNGDINFKNISFTYPKGDHVFENFNLHIPAGQSVGIVGKSGSGKTTLTKLLLRFYDVNSGKINIDGQNITHVTQSDLRSRIAYIPQETILFHRSIYENIAYGDLDANRKDVMAASKAAHVDEFVQNLTEKYETKVGERGVKLSGGQRQRIGIARAMLRKNAPILMLDEATSSLDSMSEKYIQDSFEKLSENRTTIVIAHRLSTIQKMDRIIVMEHGKIIEDGSHTELLLKNGHYAVLWNSQINGFISDDI